jgi:putative sigma-54 modulation protein
MHMQVIITARHTQVTPQLRQKIERKLKRLTRLVNEDTRVEVTVSEEQTRSAQDRFSVHLALSGSPHPFFSEVSAVNAITALDQVLDKVVKQLERWKDRQTTRRQHALPMRILALSRAGDLTEIGNGSQPDGGTASVDEQSNEQIWSQIMEIKRLPVRPMGGQEVIQQMEKSGALYYPFFNEETKSVNVMYRLERGGGYGLLVPALGEM